MSGPKSVLSVLPRSAVAALRWWLPAGGLTLLVVATVPLGPWFPRGPLRPQVPGSLLYSAPHIFSLAAVAAGVLTAVVYVGGRANHVPGFLLGALWLGALYVYLLSQYTDGGLHGLVWAAITYFIAMRLWSGPATGRGWAVALGQLVLVLSLLDDMTHFKTLASGGCVQGCGVSVVAFAPLRAVPDLFVVMLVFAAIVGAIGSDRAGQGVLFGALACAVAGGTAPALLSVPTLLLAISSGVALAGCAVLTIIGLRPSGRATGGTDPGMATP